MGGGLDFRQPSAIITGIKKEINMINRQMQQKIAMADKLHRQSLNEDLGPR